MLLVSYGISFFDTRAYILLKMHVCTLTELWCVISIVLLFGNYYYCILLIDKRLRGRRVHSDYLIINLRVAIGLVRNLEVASVICRYWLRLPKLS